MTTKRMPPPPAPVAGVPAVHRAPEVADRTWVPFQIPGIDVRLWRIDGPRLDGVPSADPCYVFREELVREFAWATWPHDRWTPEDRQHWTPCLLTGPTGSGKTSFVEQMAARCNVPVLRVNMNVGTTVRNLKGRVGARPGRTVFIPGVATIAAESGAWLLLDELSAITQPVAMCLMPILEPNGAIFLEEAEPENGSECVYVKRHPDFRIYGTDNALGHMMEDRRFDYLGTNPDQNLAVMARFLSCIPVPYMDAGLEHRAVSQAVPTVDGLDLEGMIRVADKVRKASDIRSGFSTRLLIEWARRFSAGRIRGNGTIEPGDDAFLVETARGAFLNLMGSQVERDAVLEVIRRVYELREVT